MLARSNSALVSPRTKDLALLRGAVHSRPLILTQHARQVNQDAVNILAPLALAQISHLN